MKLRVAINGFGRIGRIFLRQALERPGDIDVIAINDLGDANNLAYLLKYDSVYRTYQKTVTVQDDEASPVFLAPGAAAIKGDAGGKSLLVGGHKIAFFSEKDPAKLPWRDLQIDVVVECSGVFDSFEKASVHLTAGAKRVVISAPAKDEDGMIGQTVLLGINEERFKGGAISSNASCTTNSASPVIQIMHEEIGVKKAMLSTVHSYTATQTIVDSAVKGSDYRRGRAAAQNISPSTTGAAIAVTRAVPDLKGKFDGIAFRVPTIAASLADITFVAARKTSVEEINGIFKRAAGEPRWQGILKVVEDQLVSSDIIGEAYGAVVDLSFTKVVDGDLVKILSWYDNEWGYASTLVEHVVRAGKTI